MSQKTVQLNKTEFLLVVCMSSALGAGVGGTGVFMHEEHKPSQQVYRYPVKTEITLVEVCRLQGVNDQWSYYTALQNKDRWERCTCALEQMQKSYSWEQYKKAGTSNAKVLNSFLSACPVDQSKAPL